jgi:AcrR family transcriptional regulator
MSQPGLRERRKQKTRWAIQEHALRLFAEQGYEATTVEQIAAAAEVSPSTFFRYFATKEDTVVQDRYDPLIVAGVSAAPPELGPVAAVRYALRQAMRMISADEMDQVRQRTRLIFAVPAMRAKALDNILTTVDILAPALAARMGVPADDTTARALAGACVGALITTVPRWAEADPSLDFSTLVDEALSVLDVPVPTSGGVS